MIGQTNVRSMKKKLFRSFQTVNFIIKKRFKRCSAIVLKMHIRYLKRATELSPEDPKILMQYGVLVMEEGRFEEAHELLMTAHVT